jgi:hypothetical protein
MSTKAGVQGRLRTCTAFATGIHRRRARALPSTDVTERFCLDADGWSLGESKNGFDLSRSDDE